MKLEQHLMIIKIAAYAVVISLALTGCIYRDLSSDYQKSESTEPMTVPGDVAVVPMEPLYVIPEVHVQDQAFYDIETDGFVVPRPEAMSADKENAKIKIQKVGGARWILAEAPTSQIWPLTQNFLSQYGVKVIERKPSTGLIVTDWVEFKADAATKSQYKIRIEKGLRPEATEVHILHRQKPAQSKATAASWPQISDNDDRETWLLEELANSLAGNIDNKAASLLGQSVGGDVKAELLVEKGEPTLRLHISLARAWATVAHAVTKEGFTLWDESGDSGVLYVQHEGFATKRNWFMTLLLEDLDEEYADKVTPYTLNDLLAHLEGSTESKALLGGLDGVTFASPLANAQGYLVVIHQQGDDVFVKVRDNRGSLLDLKTNKHLLGVMRRNLI